MAIDEKERLRRWRLVLGKDAEETLTSDVTESSLSLRGQDSGIDSVLEALYGDGEKGGRSGGLGRSSPNVTRWLGDIRTYFPTAAVRVMQKDALERLNLVQLLLEPAMLERVEQAVHLVDIVVSPSG